MVQHIGAVGHGNIAQHADRNHPLVQMQGLVFAGNQHSHLLVAGGDVADGGNIHKQRR